MNSVHVYLIELPEAARVISMKAAREAFPLVQFVTATSVAAAAEKPARGRELLVLSNPDETDVGLAAQVLDGGEMPRWTVVCLGDAPSDLVETVARPDWNVPLLARVFRSALLQHDLVRENLRLRGDLKTVARRVSHDLRTPVGCIHTASELLKDSQAGQSAALRETREVVRDATAEICQVIDRVSFLLKATSDPLPASTVPMGPLVNNVLHQLQADIAQSGKAVRQPANWPEALGVPAWIESIWWNLIRNALQHGTRTGPIHLGWKPDEGSVRFWVSSPGAVPAAQQSRVLRPFHLLHQHLHPSAGLGLSLVERLVSLQGGRCGYDGTDDRRALFYFTLPLPRNEPVRATALLPLEHHERQ